MTPEQKESRDERTAIMQVEGVERSGIDKVLRQYPEIYGIENYTESQINLLA